MPARISVPRHRHGDLRLDLRDSAIARDAAYDQLLDSADRLFQRVSVILNPTRITPRSATEIQSRPRTGLMLQISSR
jgi:hypothetical protein